MRFQQTTPCMMLLTCLLCRAVLQGKLAMLSLLPSSLGTKFCVASTSRAVAIKRTTSCARDWLSQHPITGEDDIVFIKRTIAERTNSAEIAARERAQEEIALASNRSNWVGYPTHCLIHALIDHDEIKRAFHTRHNLPGGRIEVKIVTRRS